MLPEMTHKIKVNRNTTYIKALSMMSLSFLILSFILLILFHRLKGMFHPCRGGGDRDKHDTLEQGETTSPQLQ